MIIRMLFSLINMNGFHKMAGFNSWYSYIYMHSISPHHNITCLDCCDKLRMVVQYLTKYYSLYNNLNYPNSHIFISSHPYDKRVSKDNSLMMSSLPKPCPLY